MNELETLLIQSVQHWQDKQAKALIAQNIRIAIVEKELEKKSIQQKAMQTQLNALESSLLDLEPLLQRLNESLKGIKN